MREMRIVVDVETLKAKAEFRTLDGIIAGTTQQAQALGTQTSKLVDQYGRAVEPTRQFSNEQKKLGEEKKKTAGASEMLVGSILKYASFAVIGTAIQRTINYASSLEKLANSVGTTTRGIQVFENIAALSNTSVEALTNAIYQMSLRLEGGDKSALAALKKLGIELHTFMRLPAEEKLVTIAKALGQVTSAEERNRLGTDLMGRSFRDVTGAMRSDIDQLRDSVHTMTDSTVKDLNVAESWWKRLALAAQRYFGDVLAMAVPKGASPWLAAATGRMQDAAFLGGWGGAPNLPGAPAAPPSWLVGGLRESGPRPIAPTGVNDFIAQGEARRAREEMFRRLQEQDAGNVLNPRYNQSAWSAWMATQQKGFDEGPLGVFRPGAFGEPERGGAGFTPSYGFGGIQPGFQARLPGTAVAGPGFWGRTGLTGAGIGQTAIGAMMGGGSVRESVGGVVGGGLMQGLFAEKAGGIAGKIGGMAGMALGGMATMGISLAAPLIMAGIKKLAGKGHGDDKIDAEQDKYIAGQGGLDALNRKVSLMTGGTGAVQKMLDAQKPKEFAAAMAEVEAIVAKFEQTQAAFNEQLARSTELYGEVSAKLGNITTVTPDVQAALEAAWSADTPEAYADSLLKVNGILDEQAQHQKRLDELAQKYGFTLQEMGPKFAQGKLDQEWKKIIADQKDLQALGMDNDTMLRKMAGSFNKLVQESIKSGAEIPASLKPSLERLQQLGLLTDESGKKLKDLGGLKFGTTLEDTMTKMADTLGRLQETLESLPQAFERVARGGAASAGTIRRDFGQANEVLSDTGDAVDRITFGESPGGLKEIPTAAARAGAALDKMGGQASDVLTKASKDVDKFAKKLGDVKSPKPISIDPFSKEARDEKRDLERQLAILRAPTEFLKDKLRLQFDEQDEIKALNDKKKELGPALGMLIEMVKQKYALLLQQLIASQADTFHTGGIIGRLFPIAHNGLAIDERVIIGQTGEGVLSRRAMANMGRGTFDAWNRGERPGSGSTVHVTVNVDGYLDSPKAQANLVRLVQQGLDRQLRGDRLMGAR